MSTATLPATMTAEEFDRLPYEESRRWELLEGDLIEVSSATLRHQLIVAVLLEALRQYLKHNRIGLALMDVEFALCGHDRLRPDVFLLLSPKLASLDLDGLPVPGSPDLAIEVISPSERAAESHKKVRAYLRAGTAEVWQIYPLTRSMEVHRLETGMTLGDADELTTPLLPGFSLAISSLFE